jgi:hypothetical protein
MNNCKSLFFVIPLVLICTAGIAQFRNWERFEIGLNYVTALGQFNGVSSVYNPADVNLTNRLGDTTIKRSLMTSWGGGLMVGTCIPFKKLGHESIWAISLELQANLLNWADLNKVYTQNGSFVVNKQQGTLNAWTYQFALPFGVEYKVGTDAIKTQRKHLGASFGAGAMILANGTYLQSVTGGAGPTVQIKADDEHNSGFNFGFDPYVKAELAVFAGICIKLRVMASYGPLNYLYENQNTGTYTDGPFRIQGLANITASLILIPASRHWSETAWWNTYDTYNPYDKLH